MIRGGKVKYPEAARRHSLTASCYAPPELKASENEILYVLKLPGFDIDVSRMTEHLEACDDELETTMVTSLSAPRSSKER